MTLLSLFVGLTCLGADPGAQGNPCVNGSFEQAAPGGFPAAWSPIGKAEVVADAHSGKHALRLVRTNEPPTSETGVNAQNLDRLRGGIDFHYKAVAAKDLTLRIYAIPIAADGIERTGEPRAAFTVPKDHVGDKQWHHARLKYDFSKSAKVKTVIFAARLEGTSGELLLDDFSYVERVGPMLRIGSLGIDEDAKMPGRRCVVRTSVENAGDEPAKDVCVRVAVPAGLTIRPTEFRLGDLAPDAKVPARWTLDGERLHPAALDFKAIGGQCESTARLQLSPKWEVRSCGPVTPVAMVGQPFALECELVNSGQTMIEGPSVRFDFGRQSATQKAARMAPGQTAVVRATFVPREQTFCETTAVETDGAYGGERYVPYDSVVVGAATPLPPPGGSLSAAITGGCAILENEHLRLVFRRNAFGYGPGEIVTKTPSGWKTAAWIPTLGVLVPCEDFARHREAWLFSARPPKVEMKPGTAARLVFDVAPLEKPRPGYRVSVEFSLEAKAKVVRVQSRLSVDQPRKVYSLMGPMVHALARDEAVYPGLEWLVGNELSSDSLDIAASHPDRMRAVVHPNYVTIPAVGVHCDCGTVGLVWNTRQKWDGSRDRPSVGFGSPARFTSSRAHVMGLFLPSVPESVDPPALVARENSPYLLEPGKSFCLEAHIYADGDAPDALSAIDQWIKIYGIPKPAPLPHGTYEKEIEFSMQAYLKSLWVPEEKKWWTSKGAGELMSPKGLPPAYVADLLLGEILSPNPDVRHQCRARAEEVLKIIGGPARVDAQRFPGRFDAAIANSATAAGLLMSRDKEGAWRFDADQVGTGPFVGMDYHELGKNGEAEVGLCAAKATAILRYARITGDWEAYRQSLKTLEFMEQFRVPRAAQVWEVPVHSPDILAAAEAAEAYLEAYRFSGDKRWLRNAVTWARRGLPFIYLWDDPQKPFLLGASIPVYGASWMQASWFGRPVQWNGLRYAEAILALAEHDQSYPWRQIATLLTHSAIHQQDQEGENVALWPDSIGAVKGDKSAWVFAPRMIITNILTLMGRDEHVRTTIVGDGERRLHISAAAAIADAAWDGNVCTFRVTYPAGEQGTVVVFNTAKPQAVALNGKRMDEGKDLEAGVEAGWRYDPATACLSVRVPKDGSSTIRIEGAAFRSTPRLPQLAERIAFEFAEASDGWLPAHDVDEVAIRDGALTGRITGGDPYVVRSMLRVRGDDCPVLVLRMRATAGQGGQFFWMTEASPGFTEDKSFHLDLQPDGQFREYRLEVGKHAAWAGQTITGLRIDPSDGGTSGEFAIDYVRIAK